MDKNIAVIWADLEAAPQPSYPNMDAALFAKNSYQPQHHHHHFLNLHEVLSVVTFIIVFDPPKYPLR